MKDGMFVAIINEINWSPSTREKRSLGIKFLLCFPFVALFWTGILALNEKEFFWDWNIFRWIAGIGCSIGLFCVLLPSLSQPVYCIWFFFAGMVNVLLNLTLLPVFFYFVLFPSGLLIRIMRKSSICKKPPNKVSFWVDVEEPKSSGQYFRQF